MNKQQKQNTNKPQFDLKTHPRDAKGNVKRENHYRLTIKDGIKEFERPPGSGYIYAENNELIRSPKTRDIEKVGETHSAEFENNSLKKQIEELQSKLSVQAKVTEETPSEINMTAQDVTVDEIPTTSAALVDNSEELALMEAAGATQEAAQMKAEIKKFNKPNYI